MARAPHDRYDDAAAAAQFSGRRETFAKVYPQARTSHAMLYRMPWVAHDLAEIGALTGHDDMVRRGLRVSGRAAAGLFACAASPGGTARFPMDGDDVFELPALGPGFSSGPANWIEGCYAALAARDDETLDRLCDVPPESIVNERGVTSSRYSDTWRRCLRAVRRSPSDVGTLLADTPRPPYVPPAVVHAGGRT
jgi:hypothetical protein